MFPKLPTFSADQVLDIVRNSFCPCDKNLRTRKRGEPHHLPSPFGGRRRAVDIVVPRCRACHRELHESPSKERGNLDRYYLEALQYWALAYEQVSPIGVYTKHTSFKRGRMPDTDWEALWWDVLNLVCN